MQETPEELKAKIQQAKRLIAASGDQVTTERLMALLLDLERRQEK